MILHVFLLSSTSAVAKKLGLEVCRASRAGHRCAEKGRRLGGGVRVGAEERLRGGGQRPGAPSWMLRQLEALEADCRALERRAESAEAVRLRRELVERERQRADEQASGGR